MHKSDCQRWLWLFLTRSVIFLHMAVGTQAGCRGACQNTDFYIKIAFNKIFFWFIYLFFGLIQFLIWHVFILYLSSTLPLFYISTPSFILCLIKAQLVDLRSELTEAKSERTVVEKEVHDLLLQLHSLQLQLNAKQGQVEDSDIIKDRLVCRTKND